MFEPEQRGKRTTQTETLGNVCTVIRDGIHHTPKYVADGIPFVTVRNITGGELDLTGAKLISEKEHNLISRRVKPEAGDILVSKDGTIGIPCPVNTRQEFSIFVSVALLKLKQEIVDQTFLCEQIRSDYVQKQIKQSSKGIAIRHLHLEDFRRLRIIVPSMEMQRKYSKVTSTLRRNYKTVQEQLGELNALFSSLQHRAFTGAL